MPSDGRLLKRRASKLTRLKSTFNAKNFIWRFSWSICSDFGAVHSLNVSQPEIGKKFTKIHYLRVQCRSWSSVLVPPESSSAVLVMISSNLCLSATILVLDQSTLAEIARFQGGAQIWRSYGGLLEPRGPNLTPLKSTFTAEHFIGRFYQSILNGLGAVQS